MPVFFSVIVPVYNVERYLPQCLDSILAQLILVDDGSPDGCGAICDEYAGRDSRVAVIHQKNAGVVAARAAGLAMAQAEYICFVDSDDYISPDCLENIRRHAENSGHPDVLLHGVTLDFGDHLEPQPLRPEPGFYGKQALRESFYPRMMYDRDKPFFRRYIPTGIWYAWKRELFLAHYMEPEWWPLIKEYEDVCVTYECMWHARSAYVCPELMYYYRFNNPTSATTAYFPGHVRNLSACIRYLNTHLGTQAPEMKPQINAHMTLRSITSIAQEFHCGHSYFQALRHVRREMNAVNLPSQLSCRGLPAYICIFVLCLKLRLYFLAVLATKLRMNSGASPQFV